MLLFCNNGYSQANINVGFGYSVLKNPFFAFGVGAEKKRMNYNAEYRRALNSGTSTHEYFGGSVGYNLLNEGDAHLFARSVIPAIGIYEDKFNTDQKNNEIKVRMSLGIKYTKAFDDNWNLYAELFYIHNTIQLSGGMKFKFVR